ncbi:MAG: MFS transporter [Dehalococcoidia bacterium]|nr:MFS transporter [Dehalococcoidia bacterium]
MSDTSGSDAEAGTGGEGGTGRISLGKHTFRSFRNPVYRLFFFAMVGLMAPMNMQIVGRSLLIYRITGSAAVLGAVTLAFSTPMLLMSLFGGIIADRLPKKYVIVAGMLGAALVSLGVALALTLGYLSPERPGSVWILAVAGAIQGTVMALMMPSRMAILPEIVGREQLMNAVSLSALEMNALRLGAPALAGFIIEGFGFDVLYYTMAGFYLMGGILTAFLPRTSNVVARGGKALAQIREGLTYIRHNTTILLILLFTIFAVFLTMPYYVLMPVFTEDILMVGAGGLGILFSVSGGGAIIGSLILASLPNRRRGLMFLIGSLVLSLALIGFSLSRSWPLSLALTVVVGMGHTSRMALSNTLLQYYTAEEYRGRVMSVYTMEFGLMGFGALAAGLLTEVAGIQWAIGGFAATLVLVTLLAAVVFPRIRKLD